MRTIAHPITLFRKIKAFRSSCRSCGRKTINRMCKLKKIKPSKKKGKYNLNKNMNANIR